MSLSVLTRVQGPKVPFSSPVPVLAGDRSQLVASFYGQVLTSSPAVIADRGRCPGPNWPFAPQPTKMKMMGRWGMGMCDWHPSDCDPGWLLLPLGWYIAEWGATIGWRFSPRLLGDLSEGSLGALRRPGSTDLSPWAASSSAGLEAGSQRTLCRTPRSALYLTSVWDLHLGNCWLNGHHWQLLAQGRPTVVPTSGWAEPQWSRGNCLITTWAITTAMPIAKDCTSQHSVTKLVPFTTKNTKLRGWIICPKSQSQ